MRLYCRESAEKAEWSSLSYTEEMCQETWKFEWRVKYRYSLEYPSMKRMEFFSKFALIESERFEMVKPEEKKLANASDLASRDAEELAELLGS